MRSLSFSVLARMAVAALFLAVFATGAHTQAAEGPSGHAPGPSSGPATAAGHGPDWLGAVDPSDCGGGLALAAPSPFGDAGGAVKALSRATQAYIKQCRCASQQCVADALDQYADALAAVAPRLPPELQDLPIVVARAAHRVRAARTKGEAVKALHEAIALIHKDMSLVRAEDPETQQRQTRSGGFVADTLNVASLSLEKAGGL
ncbi:MAG: hypothetical protein ACLPGW_14475 [Roseiarcus sp.]